MSQYYSEKKGGYDLQPSDDAEELLFHPHCISIYMSELDIETSDRDTDLFEHPAFVMGEDSGAVFGYTEGYLHRQWGLQPVIPIDQAATDAAVKRLLIGDDTLPAAYEDSTGESVWGYVREVVDPDSASRLWNEGNPLPGVAGPAEKPL